jgi:hypothetical protein
MKHLISSFQTHVGERGCHFYDEDSCTFLNWQEVFQFISHLPTTEKMSPFTERLADSLANYNPDVEFQAVQQAGKQVSVELYSQSR